MISGRCRSTARCSSRSDRRLPGKTGADAVRRPPFSSAVLRELSICSCGFGGQAPQYFLELGSPLVDGEERELEYLVVRSDHAGEGGVRAARTMLHRFHESPEHGYLGKRHANCRITLLNHECVSIDAQRTHLVHDRGITELDFPAVGRLGRARGGQKHHGRGTEQGTNHNYSPQRKGWTIMRLSYSLSPRSRYVQFIVSIAAITVWNDTRSWISHFCTRCAPSPAPGVSVVLRASCI